MEHTLSVTEAMKKFVTNIKKKYKGRRLIHEEQLLCCSSEKLVRLELVERERLQPSEQRGTGDNKTPLAYTDLFKVESGKKEIKTILIDGDAGIGKTTFCTALSESWANGEILQEFELVLLLALREQEVASAGSVLDLLKLLHPNQKVCDLVKEYIEEDEGNILVIADGWDELGKEKRDNGSFLYKFLFGSHYCSMSTVVTSRPSASASLHHGKYIDRFAEIRGFDKEHIVDYINSEFANDYKKASELLKKLESNPIIESICSIPLNCVIICHLWQMKGELPTTMTGLYTQIIFNIILCNIRKVFPAHENILSLSSFDDLPESLQESWWLLCKFAFQTLKKDQLVFSDKELNDFFPQGLALCDNSLCFGLLQSSVSSLVVGCGKSFHFLHLTFQEYLAALYLVKQESNPQVADCSSLFSRLTTLFPLEDPHSIVSRFFFGIVFNFEAFRSTIGQRILTMFPSELCSYYTYRVFSHFLWAFEAQNDELAHIIAKHCRRFYSKLNPSTVHEVIAMAYVIAFTEYSGIVINFHSCGLHDNHIMALTNALANKGGKLQVKSLNLYGNKLTDKGVTDLFHRASAAFQSMECLILGWNGIQGEGIDMALATLAKPKHEVKFYFYDNPLEVSSLMVFRNALCCHQLSNLTMLHLEGSLSSNAEANADFILALDKCINLRVLDLSRNNLYAPGGRALGKVLPQLSLNMLKASEAMLGDEGIAALAQSLDGTCYIDILILANNGIHAAGASSLANSVCAGNIVIEDVLCLDDNSLFLKGVLTLMIKLLLTENFLVCDLSLKRCKLTTVGDNDARTLSDKSITHASIREFIYMLISKPNSIENLYLCDSFTGEGIHILAGFMCLCPHLKVLDCSDCQVTSNDLKQLLSLLSQLKLNYLETWDLSQNTIDDNGVSALIEQLPMFPSLTHVDVNGNEYISPEVVTYLKESLEKRRKANFQNKMEQRRQIRHMCVDKAVMMDSSFLAHTVSNQCSLSDSMELTRLEPHPIHQEVETMVAEGPGEISPGHNNNSSDDENYHTPPSSPAAKRMKLQEDESIDSTLETRIAEKKPHLRIHQKVQQVETIVAEGLISHRRNEGSSDSEDYLTPLSSPAPKRLQEDESEQSTLEVRATNRMSSVEEARQSRTVASEEVNLLHPIRELTSERTATTGLQLKDIDSALEEITDPHRLGVYLNIKPHKLVMFERDYPGNTDRQKTEVINYWLRNCKDCSWEILAGAVEKMGGHGNLVKRLRDMHLEVLKTATKQVHT